MKSRIKMKVNNLKLATFGFTLIELLAIIVILAIIAVITVPIIINVIDNSKKGAVIDSVYGFKDSINKSLTIKLLEDSNYVFSDGEYDVVLDNEIVKLVGETSLEVNISGMKPSGGTIKIENNNIVSGNLEMDDYCIDVISMQATKGKCDSANDLPFICKKATTLNRVSCDDNLTACGWDEFDKNGTPIFVNRDAVDFDEYIYGNLVSGNTLKIGDALDCAVKDITGDCVIDENDMTERFYYVTDLEGNSDYAVLLYSRPIERTVSQGGDLSINTLEESLKYTIPSEDNWKTMKLTNTKRDIYYFDRIYDDNDDISVLEKRPNAVGEFYYDNKYNMPRTARLLSVAELSDCYDGEKTIFSLRGLEKKCKFLFENMTGPTYYYFWLEESLYDESYNNWYVNGFRKSVTRSYFHDQETADVKVAVEVPKSQIYLKDGSVPVGDNASGYCSGSGGGSGFGSY